MHKLINILLLSFLLSAIVHGGLGQANFWEQTGGPRSSYVTSLVIKSDETIFGGTERGVLRSTDGGETWEITSLSNVDVHALVVTPNGYIFAGTDSAGILRSGDNGLSWDSVNTGLLIRSVVSLATNASGRLVADMKRVGWEYEYGQSGIYLSSDYGDHWTLVASPPCPCMVALNESGDMFAGYRWGGIIGRSTDNAKSWVWTDLGKFYSVTRLLVNSRGHVFVGTERCGIFRSTDNGATWDSASIGLPYRTFDEAVPGCTVEDLALASGDTLFAATYLDGVFRSINNGQTWAPTSLGSPVSILAADPRGALYAGRASVYRSSDYGDHWTRLNVPSWQEIPITNLTVNRGDTLYAGSWRQGLFCSTDHGDSWKEILLVSYRSGEGVGFVAVNARGHLFVSFSRDLGSQCYRSTDHGKNWVALPIGLWSIPPVFDNKGNIFGVSMGWGSPAVYRSTDNGDSWKLASTGLPDQNCYSLVITSQGGLFVGTAKGDIYRSTDNGEFWTQVNNSLPGTVVHLSTSPSGDVFLGTDYYADVETIFRSTDNGESWQSLYSVSTGIQAMVGDAAGNLFVATDTMGVYRNGIPVNAGLSTLCVSALVLDSRGYLFAGTGGWVGKPNCGVFRSVQPTTAVEQVPNELPTAFVLQQNYPNPFNPSTTIRYGLPHKSAVQLTVINTLGQQVATLVHGEQEVGDHEVRFDASALSSGVYFYRIQAEDFVSTMRMLVLK